MRDGIKRKCCPKCGGRIVISDLCQYGLVYKIRKTDGKKSRRYVRKDYGSIEASLAACESKCGVSWECDEFAVDWDGVFYDYKYDEDLEDGNERND